MVRFKSRKLDHGKQTLTRIGIELLETEMGKYTVFTDNRHKVGSDADHQKVQQRYEAVERNVVTLRIGLHELEAHTAAGKVVERIVAVLPFRVQDGHGSRKFVFRKVMVTDDHVDALGLCIIYLFVGLDAAVKGYDEAEAVLACPVDAFVRHSISFVVSFRDIEVHLAGQSPEE